MKDHIIICGLGHVGFSTFEILRLAKQKIAVISDQTDDEWRWQVEATGGIFLEGDARSDKLLIKAGIKEAKAILALTDKDMVNVSIIIDARNLNPNIKIISRMFDTDVGKHISEAFKVHQVFSTSELAAPIFAIRIYEDSALAEFSIDPHTYFISEETGNVVDYEDKGLAIIATLATKSKFLVANPLVRHKKKISKIFLFLRKFSYLRSPIFANFRRFLLVLLCVILLSALFLKWAMSLPFIDALYFVTTTVTTVGYGDFNFSHSAAWLKLFGCLLMLSGAAALAILFSSITEIILTNKLPSILGGRLVPRKNHVIVVGSGHIGHRLVTNLVEDKFSIVVVEDDTRGRYAEDLKRQVALVDGNPRSSNTLARANVKKAKAIIVITEDDVENLSVSLAARKLNPAIINIVQVFNSRLAEKLQTALSLNKVLSVSSIAAPYYAAAVFGEKILLALTWENQLIFISEDLDDKEISASSQYFKIKNKIKKNIKIFSIPLDPQ